jgi:hypothetical protein
MSSDNTKNNKKPITLVELKQLAKGTIIDIPGYEDGTLIQVKVKKVDFTKELMSDKFSLTSLVSKDVIDKMATTENQKDQENLIAGELAKEGKSDNLMELIPLIDDMCKQVLISPTWEEFEEIYPLTTNQKYAIFNWIVEGLTDIKPFRKQ